ncbi:DNA mismatch repair protein MutS [Fervidobacterium nodosum]|uniref:DNA mismatch repair protein MutS n=1 Tax=Fervidobacterium nodosum (strain ATCC 35602 / DSM 5306 / Rt17-B1) TaxID=381764 RepID=MUTS_FERNB|nr:DNA mismatch repair protein MutS [Fervidobacterium nodosum]A7HMG4.1 RecName: Full=DNA mismatch repair protein MutS [Fervidobacterium nodosum Rt17-B1]ABS61097.1 DNA mismatch repair protein MutS [Fervidobacterium nodosum Rt17-B1]
MEKSLFDTKNLKITPMMKQYLDIKDKYKDSILLFRLGDFYEAFFDDALTVSKILNIVLTKRQDAPMAGIPYHALDNYLKKLVDAGYKVAICEQMEDPALAKGIVKREVTRVITPGTIIEDELLTTENNYMMSLYETKDGKISCILTDSSTGEVIIKQMESIDEISDFLQTHRVSQIICPENFYDKIVNIARVLGIFVDKLDDWYYENDIQTIKEAYGLVSIEHFELGEASKPLCATIKYINYTLNRQAKLKVPKTLDESKYMTLDSTTVENLSLIPGDKGKNLYDVLNKTNTPMGGRLLKWVILHPLKDRNEIEKRLWYVEAFYEDPLLTNEIREYLNGVYDLERIINRLEYDSAKPKDLISLKTTLEVVEPIKEALSTNEKLIQLAQMLPDLSQIKVKIENTLLEEFEGELGEGKIIKEGVSKELDEYRELLYHSNEKLKEFEERERAKTGIQKLKVSFNNVFGYYIEIPKGQVKFAPQEYTRIQTLVNAERYTTTELKEFEQKILAAKEKVEILEKTIFKQICDELKGYTQDLRKLAEMLSWIDVYSNFAYVSKLYSYSKPEISDSEFKVLNGRHPVVERFVDEFVPNDIYMSDELRMYILTGPNMSGKSTYIRQVGLIALMTQIGCFVPAQYAKVPVFDRIFTRMGARDDISTGKSTFLTEMNEVALILSKATQKSLVLLDEVGRGTSTFDGISIAWAMSEYIYNEIKCKTIFATHFTELTELSEGYSGIKNLTVDVKETPDGVVFLHKVVEGVADRSYGIEVAAIAGLPESIIERAKEILNIIVEKSDLEKKVGVLKEGQMKKIKATKKSVPEGQMKLF